jgi:hypothetical protein
VTFTNVQSSATTRTTIRIKYLNGDSSQRFADVSVNDGAAQRIAFVPASSNSDPNSSSFHADLNAGANMIRFSMSGSRGPDVDRLMVPTS